MSFVLLNVSVAGNSRLVVMHRSALQILARMVKGQSVPGIVLGAKLSQDELVRASRDAEFFALRAFYASHGQLCSSSDREAAGSEAHAGSVGLAPGGGMCGEGGVQSVLEADLTAFRAKLLATGETQEHAVVRVERALWLMQQVWSMCAKEPRPSEAGTCHQASLFEESDAGSVEANGMDELERTSSERVKRVLVIEDDRAVGAIIKRVVASGGDAVDLVSDPMVALRMLQEENRQYGLAIVDLTLPGISGDELLRRLRSSGNRVPAVVVSGLGEPHARAACKSAPADAFVSKPFTPSVLLDAMGTARTARPAG